MIHFFRKIRRSLLADGKTFKYLKYAMGEIALVVIGILIALSINNWNDTKNKGKAEDDIYNNTRLQLLEDKENIKNQITYSERYAEQFRYAIELIESKMIDKKDTLGIMAINLTNYSDSDRQGNIYETIANSGDLKLLKNKEIVEGLRRLQETFNYVNRLESIHFEIVMAIAPYLINTVSIASGEVKDEESLFSYQFQNQFVLALRITGEKEDIYMRAIEEIDRLVEMIETELEMENN